CFFFSSRRRHTRSYGDWSSDVCSSDLVQCGEMLRFQHGSVEAFVTDRPYDLIFSNAALHWVADHESIFRRLTGFVSRDGQLAVRSEERRVGKECRPGGWWGH